MGDERYQRAEDMVRDADTAMYRAKALGKARYEIFDTSMLAAAEERLHIESDLRRAVERQELRLHYQPIVRLHSDRRRDWPDRPDWSLGAEGGVPPDAGVGRRVPGVRGPGC